MSRFKLRTALLGCAFSLAASAALATPSLVHQTQNNVSSGHSVTTVSVTTAANDIVLFPIGYRLAASGDVPTITGSVEGAIPTGQINQCRIASGANGGGVGWFKSAGATQTFTFSDGTGAASSTGLFIGVDILTGVDTATTIDGFSNCTGNNGTAANPTGTSAAASVAGDLSYSQYISPTLSGYAPTPDPAWTFPTNECTGNSNLVWCGAWRIMPTTSAVTRQDLVTSRQYSYTFINIKSSGVVAPAAKPMMHSIP